MEGEGGGGRKGGEGREEGEEGGVTEVRSEQRSLINNDKTT